MKPQGLLLIGLLLGFAAGLAYTWELNPVQYYDSYPPLLRSDYRHDWITLTAFAYGHTGDLSRAQLRLQQLPEAEIRPALESALNAAIAGGRPHLTLQRLAILAQTYGVENTAVQIYTTAQENAPVPAAETTTSPALPTSAPSLAPPTLTAPPTLDPQQFLVLPTIPPPPLPYQIEERQIFCLSEPQITISLTQEISVTERGKEIRVRQGRPGVIFWLLWDGGADRAVTGLHPAQGLGYADFAVEPEQTYNLYLDTPTGAPLITLKIVPCVGATDKWSSWRILLHYTGED